MSTLNNDSAYNMNKKNGEPDAEPVVADTDPFAPEPDAEPVVADTDPFAPEPDTEPVAAEIDLFVLEIEPPFLEDIIFNEKKDIPDFIETQKEFEKEMDKENEKPITNSIITNAGFFSELNNLSKQFEETKLEEIILPDIVLSEKKSPTALPSLSHSENSQNEKDENSQNEKDFPFLNIPAVTIDSLSQEKKSIPLQRQFFEGFEQTPISIQTNVIAPPQISSLGTPLAKEWAYDVARGPVFSFMTEKDPEDVNERGIIESIPALLLRLGFLRFQYHSFSLQAYQMGHISIGQVLEQFNAMLETGMKKFAGLSSIGTYSLQTLQMEISGPGVFVSEEIEESLHWLLCEEERFHLVILPELSGQMAEAGQAKVYEALLQFSSGTALRYAWLTVTHNKLVKEFLYSSPEKTGWVCLSCGHVLFEKEPFDCPFCAALPCSFVLLEQFGYFIKNINLIEK